MRLFFLGSLVLAAASVVGPASASAAAPTSPRQAVEQPRIDPLVLDVEGPGANEVRDAIRLRLPGRALLTPDEPRPESELLGYTQVRPSPAGEVTIALILVDRRAYYRNVSADPDFVAREVASTVANLVAGIEAGALPADETDVAIPEPEPPAEPSEAVEEPQPVVPDPEPLPPRFELGLSLAPMAVFALAPPSPQGLAAGGGSIRFDLRHRVGAFATADLRATGLASAGFGLARLRIGLGGGWAWRRGQFELITAALLAIEPAWVRDGGRRVPLVPADGDGPDRQTAFLLGGHLRLAPLWRRPLGQSVALRLGPFIELGGSALPDAGIARIRSATEPPTDLFRLGGLELAAGLELGLWWWSPG